MTKVEFMGGPLESEVIEVEFPNLINKPAEPPKIEFIKVGNSYECGRKHDLGVMIYNRKHYTWVGNRRINDYTNEVK